MTLETDSGDSEKTDNQIVGTGIRLSEHVSVALEHYFKQINGHPVCGLYEMVIREVEKPLIKSVLEQCGHNQSKASEMLGMSRGTLRKKMASFSID